MHYLRGVRNGFLKWAASGKIDEIGMKKFRQMLRKNYLHHLKHGFPEKKSVAKTKVNAKV